MLNSTANGAVIVSDAEATIIVSNTEHTTKKDDLHPISARIDKDLYKSVKIFTVTEEIKFNDFVQEALESFLKIKRQGTLQAV